MLAAKHFIPYETHADGTRLTGASNLRWWPGRGTRGGGTTRPRRGDEPLGTNILQPGLEGPAVELKEGMVFNLEPYYGKPEVGGIRLEDDHIITSDGVEIYTKYRSTSGSSSTATNLMPQLVAPAMSAVANYQLFVACNRVDVNGDAAGSGGVPHSRTRHDRAAMAGGTVG